MADKKVEVRDINRGYALSLASPSLSLSSEVLQGYELNKKLFYKRLWAFTDSNASLVDEYLTSLCKVICLHELEDTEFSIGDLGERVKRLTGYLVAKRKSLQSQSKDTYVSETSLRELANKEGVFTSLVHSPHLDFSNLTSLIIYLGTLIRALEHFVNGTQDKEYVLTADISSRATLEVKTLAYFIVLGCILAYFE